MQTNPIHQYILGASWLENSFADKKLGRNQVECAPARCPCSKECQTQLGCVGKIVASRSREVLLRYVKPVSELLHPGLPSMRDTWTYMVVQQRAIKMINRLHFLSNEVRLGELCFFSLKKRGLSRILPILCINNLMLLLYTLT